MDDLRTLNKLSLGKAGELRVASELLLRGHEIFLTVTDTGVDLILGDGKRLQVKTARVNKYERYRFSLEAWRKKGNPPKAQPFTDIDYFICWAVNDGSFFIIPTPHIIGKIAIDINPNSTRSQFMVFKNNWEVLNKKGV